MTRAEELRQRIAQAAASYWETGISAISDEEYDRLVEELRALTGEEDVIGAPKVLSSGKVEHPADRPMLSMRKTYDRSEVVRWAMKYAPGQDLIVMPKYDGIALCHYDNGVIATRGDGKVGEDVTQVAARFVEGWGYGEAICRLSVFKEKMEALGYKNPRNAVSGILSSLDPEIQQRAADLTFCVYHRLNFRIRGWKPAAPGPLAREDEFLRLDHVLDYARGRVVEELAADFPIDGVVIRIADDDAFYALGHTDHHWRGQIALKFANEATESIIERIDWQEKNGTVTPVATIAPVTLGGAEISHVTLHNADWVRSRDIRVGDGCRVERAGGVIPKLVMSWRRDQHSGPRILPPTTCPTCGGPLKVSGARLYCDHCDK